MKIQNQSRVQSPESRVQRRRTGDCGLRTGNCESGFTMVEIAICLAIIGFALVAIIGVLPIGMNTQRDNREETIINQDATVFIEAIRNGAQGLDDLTNYVYAITNYWTIYPGPVVGGEWLYLYRFLDHTVVCDHQRRTHHRIVEHAGICGHEHILSARQHRRRRLHQQSRRRLCPFHQRTGGGKTAAGQSNHSSRCFWLPYPVRQRAGGDEHTCLAGTTICYRPPSLL